MKKDSEKFSYFAGMIFLTIVFGLASITALETHLEKTAIALFVTAIGCFIIAVVMGFIFDMKEHKTTP